LAGFGVGFSLIAMLPVMFIELRQGFVWYLPMVGLALLSGVVLDVWLSRVATVRWAVPVAVSLILLPPSALGPEQEGLLRAQSVTWNAVEQIRSTDLRLPPNSSILIKDDPFQGNWDMYFILRLYFRDPSLHVAFLARSDGVPRGDLRTTYDAVLRFDGDRLIQEQSPRIALNTTSRAWT
jgi:hypothetical protein